MEKWAKIIPATRLVWLKWIWWCILSPSSPLPPIHHPPLSLPSSHPTLFLPPPSLPLSFLSPSHFQEAGENGAKEESCLKYCWKLKELCIDSLGKCIKMLGLGRLLLVQTSSSSRSSSFSACPQPNPNWLSSISVTSGFCSLQWRGYIL